MKSRELFEPHDRHNLPLEGLLKIAAPGLICMVISEALHCRCRLSDFHLKPLAQ